MHEKRGIPSYNPKKAFTDYAQGKEAKHSQPDLQDKTTQVHHRVAFPEGDLNPSHQALHQATE